MSNQNEQAAPSIPPEMRANMDSAMGIGMDLARGRSTTAWDELDLAEKVERLREQLRTKEMAIQDLREGLAKLMSHQHGPMGELLGPIGYGGVGYQQPFGRRYDPLA